MLVNPRFDKNFLHLNRCKSIKFLYRFVWLQSNKNYSFLKTENTKCFSKIQ